jgi:hypothetical protein
MAYKGKYVKESRDKKTGKTAELAAVSGKMLI